MTLAVKSRCKAPTETEIGSDGNMILVNLIIMLSLGSIETDDVVSETML